MFTRSLCFLILVCCFLTASFPSLSAEEECNACSTKLQPKLTLFGWRMCAIDIDAELLFLFRDSDFDAIDLTSDGISGAIVLNTGHLDLGWNFGWRVTGEIFFDNCDRIEVSYLAAGEWNDSERVRSADDALFSVFSNFGTDPIGGFQGTDQASVHRIKCSSEFYSWEINYHNHLSIFEVPCLCCLDGSVLYGYRYFNLEEEFEHFTESTLNNASMNYCVDTHNELHGIQAGVEAWLPVCACFDLGVVAKGAAYINKANQKTLIVDVADLPDGPLSEEKDEYTLAWGLEGSVKACFEILPNLYLRGGYLILFLDNVALAVDNFNKKTPFGNSKRSKKLSTSGQLAVQGVTVGLDWCW